MKNATRYTVRVMAVIETVESSDNEWGIVDHVPSGETTKAGDPLLKPKMGFLPAAMRKRTREQQIYEQTVEAPVDLAKLVQVVNGSL